MLSVLNRQNINSSVQSSSIIKHWNIHKMTQRIDKILDSFYCQTALRLCLEARALCERGECKKVAEICSYVSTLCSENSFETCCSESSLCREVAKRCQTGRASEDCKKARMTCDEAKKLCPQNNVVSGA